MTCDEARRRVARATDGSAAEAEFWHHLNGCVVCSTTLEEQTTVSYLLQDLAAVCVPPDFSTRVRARIADRASLLAWTDWKSWTLRLAPLAVGLLLIAGTEIGRAPSRDFDSLIEQWLAVRGHLPATALFWHDAPDEILLEAVIDGRPEAAMRNYYVQGPHDH
jgi:hypothetical protein